MAKVSKETSTHILSVGTKILLKDVMDQYLRSLGDVKTFYASKLSTAVESAMEKKPQIIFCEQFFPEGSALDLIQRIGGLHRCTDNYFVLATESTSDELVALAVELNIDEILVKPFSIDNIHKIVERYQEKLAEQKMPWHDDLRAAIAANLAKRFHEAEALFFALSTKYPNQLDLLLECTEFFYHRLNYDLCLQLMETVLKISPNNARALNIAGSALKKSGKPREALDRLHKASNFSPLNNHRNIEIADIHMMLADEQITLAQRMDTENTNLVIQKAKILFVRKDYTSTVQYLDAKRAFLSPEGKRDADALVAVCKKLGGIK